MNKIKKYLQNDIFISLILFVFGVCLFFYIKDGKIDWMSGGLILIILAISYLSLGIGSYGILKKLSIIIFNLFFKSVKILYKILLFLTSPFNPFKNKQLLKHTKIMAGFYLTLLKWSYKQDNINTKKRIIDYFIALKEQPKEVRDEIIKEIALSWRIEIPKNKKGILIINNDVIIKKLFKRLDEHSKHDYLKGLNEALKKNRSKRTKAYKKFIVFSKIGIEN